MALGEGLVGQTNNLRKHASHLLDGLVGAIGVFEVDVRRPVGRFVFDDTTRGAVGVDKVLVG